MSCFNLKKKDKDNYIAHEVFGSLLLLVLNLIPIQGALSMHVVIRVGGHFLIRLSSIRLMPQSIFVLTTRLLPLVQLDTTNTKLYPQPSF